MTRGDIWLAAFEPTVGAEIQKTRPCVIISPPEMHDHLRTVIVAPMTTQGRAAPFRVPITFGAKRGLILFDQLRALDKVRLIKKLGKAAPRTVAATLHTLQSIFAD